MDTSLKDPILIQQLFSTTKDDCALFCFLIDSKSITYKSLLLPIFTLDFKVLVHEITHAICNHALIFKETDEECEVIYGSLFNTEELDELINDYIASLVCKEYKRLGYKIPKVLNHSKCPSLYEELDLLVSYFYNSLEPLILESLITGNHLLLQNYVGKDNLDNYGTEVARIFNSEDNITQEVYDSLCIMVDNMYENTMSTPKENVEVYLNDLENRGYKLRRLR